MGEQDYSGMTVNERLFTAGLIDRWDSAIHAADREAASAVLDMVGLASQSSRIVDAVLENPGTYGFSR